MPFTLSEQTEQYIISAKNDTPFDELSVDKRKNDKRSMKDMFNFKKVLSFGTLESSSNFLCRLQETLEDYELKRIKIKSFYQVKKRLSYLENQFSTLEDCFSNDIDNIQEVFPELFMIDRSQHKYVEKYREDNEKYKNTFKIIDMIKKYNQLSEELHVIKNNLEETTIKECNEKVEYYKNELTKEFHKTDLYDEMNQDIQKLESNKEHILELLEIEKNKNKELLKEKKKVEDKLLEYTKEDNQLTMRTLEMNKTEREVREENKKLKKQVMKFKEMIMDTM